MAKTKTILLENQHFTMRFPFFLILHPNMYSYYDAEAHISFRMVFFQVLDCRSNFGSVHHLK
jgi:hypothetical protein